MIINCEQCGNWILFGSPACRECGAVCTDDYWRSYIDNSNSDDSGNKLTPTDITWSTTLCCNKDEEFCNCEYSMPWDEVMEIDLDVYDWTYANDSPCSNCDFYWTPRCIPYRNFCYNYLLTNELPPPITGCEFFSYNNH